MRRKNKNIEFISSKQENKEVLKETLKGFIDGRLVSSLVHKNIVFVLYIVLLALIYISNVFYTERAHRRRMLLEEEVKELRFESIATSSKLMFKSKESEVLKYIEKKGLELHESDVPPIKIQKR